MMGPMGNMGGYLELGVDPRRPRGGACGTRERKNAKCVGNAEVCQKTCRLALNKKVGSKLVPNSKTYLWANITLNASI